MLAPCPVKVALPRVTDVDWDHPPRYKLPLLSNCSAAAGAMQITLRRCLEHPHITSPVGWDDRLQGLAHQNHSRSSRAIISRKRALIILKLCISDSFTCLRHVSLASMNTHLPSYSILAQAPPKGEGRDSVAVCVVFNRNTVSTSRRRVLSSNGC